MTGGPGANPAEASVLGRGIGMEDRLERIEARLDAMERRLAYIEQAASLISPEETRSAAARTAEALGDESVSNVATHLGRVLLIFGGAYLLRAITDFEFLPTQAGIPIGIAYALIWLYLAFRFGATASRRVSAMLYGCVSVLLVLPILVEAVTHFKLLTGPSTAVALLVFCVLALGVGVWRNLRSLGWLTVIGGLGTVLLLMRASSAAASLVLVLLLLGFASLWIRYLRGWKGLQWLAALGANMGVVLLAVLSMHEQWSVSPLACYFFGIVLWAGYLVSFVVRSHIQGQDPGIFEAVQAVTASAIAFGAGIFVTRFGPVYMLVLGVAALLFAVVAYGLAFTPRTREARGRSFYFYSTLGMVLVVGGSAVLMPASLAAIILALLALAMAWLSGRQERVSLSLQCTVLLIAAGVASGALQNTLHALVGEAGDWPSLAIAQIVVGVAAVASLFLPVAQRSERWGRMAGLPQIVALALSVWIVGGQIVTLLAPILAGVAGDSPDLGKLATLRTAVLAAAAVTLAISSRYKRWPEARWLAYPVLVAVGVKLVFEDFPHGRPATLFMALALVGGALILVAKFLPKRSQRHATA